AAQSRDFNEFRRLLAGAAPAVPVEAASRTASGQVQAQVQDAKPGTAAPDKLTLSKGAVKAVAEDEKLAQQKQSADQSNRVDELKRNIAELNQIAAASKPDGVPATGAVADPAAPTTAATEGTKPAVAQDPSATAATGNVAPAGNAAATDGSAPTATPAPKPAPVAAPAPAPAEPGFIDNLLADPTIPLAGAAILALLLGYGGYRVAQRRKAAAVTGDSTLIDSRLDSFFGSSGGQRVDTGISSQMSGHSMHYSPSQLDAGDVDPLAEADVYLAYGRDLQAEEILKEALRSTPNRLALHQKLGEIYAKRHDRLSFEATANHVYALTQGQGVEWQRLSDQGRILDPDNALYQPGGSPQPRSAASAQAFMPSQFSATEPASTQRREPPAWLQPTRRFRPATSHPTMTVKALPPCRWTWIWAWTWIYPAVWPMPVFRRSQCLWKPIFLSPALRTLTLWSSATPSPQPSPLWQACPHRPHPLPTTA
ncbi:MAG: hypothetical protein RR687_11155, partial [Comamonas sp.]